MMNILIAPDKFKGSLTSQQVCDAIEKGCKDFNPSVQVIKQPLADGGEGTIDLLGTVLFLEKVEVEVSDPLFKPIKTHYFKNKEAAFIEMANASGLLLLNDAERNPMYTSTFGTGQMIAHALDQNVKEVFLMIGGSATNDGGIGMASALGWEFGLNELLPTGLALKSVREAHAQDVHSGLSSTKFTVLCDVQNPLLGLHGATQVYAAQKGAVQSDIKTLENGLEHLAKLLNNGYESLQGAGAAGGLGFGAMSFLDAELKSGIHTVMELLGFEAMVMDADLIITGEGKMDAQTDSGKVIQGVSDLASRHKVPMAVICGVSEGDSSKDFPVYQIIHRAKSEQDAMRNASEYVTSLTIELLSDFSR